MMRVIKTIYDLYCLWFWQFLKTRSLCCSNSWNPKGIYMTIIVFPYWNFPKLEKFLLSWNLELKLRKSKAYTLKISKKHNRYWQLINCNLGSCYPYLHMGMAQLTNDYDCKMCKNKKLWCYKWLGQSVCNEHFKSLLSQEDVFWAFFNLLKCFRIPPIIFSKCFTFIFNLAILIKSEIKTTSLNSF